MSDSQPTSLQAAPAPTPWLTPTRAIPRGPAITETMTAERIMRWLLGPARAIHGPAELLEALSERLCAAGLPLARTTFHVSMLHPQFISLFCKWDRKVARIEEGVISHGVRDQDAYRLSPLRAVFENGETVRRRLDTLDSPPEFPILVELKASGLTDYVATPIEFFNARTSAATWATDRPGGFSETDLAQIDALLPALGMLLEIQALRQISTNLLDVYLGRQTGKNVLSGAITRGSGETIRAVLLSSDLRGFTSLSDRLPGEQVIAILNAYFERVVAAIHAQHGEVLKFIGDGLLAIFPIEDAAFAYNAARRAIDASIQAFERLDAFNREPGRASEPMLRMGIALHVGDVIYGNIGGKDRLDFTTIGPAVNLVSRMQLLSKRLDRSLLLSHDIAKICERPLVSLGFQPVRGLSDPQEVFTLRDWDDPTAS
jgi:adenylate cyclase